MKKISLLLIALIAAIAANAQIYVMGDGTGLSWTSFPGLKIEADAEGNYTHTFQSLNSFKVSNVAGTNWDGFNSGAKQLSSGSFGDAVYPGGQTLNLTSGSENNIDTPWDGVYTLTIDKNFTTITLKTTTPKPTNAPDAYIVGGMNSWGINQAYKFNVTEEGNNYVYTLETNINANTEFKIAGANGSAVNWGGAINYSTGGTVSETQINNGTAITATYNNSNNMKLAVNFSGTVTLTIPKTAKQNGTIKFTKGDVEKTYPETLYLLGNVNEYAWNPTQGVKMSKTSKTVFETEATITGAEGGSVGYFAFSENLGANDGDWAGLGTRYGAKTSDLAITDGTPMDLMVTADNSFKSNTGYYKIVVDLENMKMTATSVQAPAEEFTELYVIGTLEDHVWDNNGSPAMINEGDGIFTADVTLLPADGDDKAYFAITKKLGDWDTVVNPNRFGPETDNELIEGEGEIEIEGVTKHNTSWTIAPGYYTFTFITEDPENLMLVVEKTGDLPEPLEPTSYSDRVSSSVEQGTNTFDYYLEYTVVRNADKTLTIEPTYVFKGEEPSGKVNTYNIYIDANEGGRLYVGEGNNDGEGRTTTGTTFNDGDVVKITFTKAISMKNMEDVVSYTVGSEQEMPEMPEDPEPTNELVEVWKKENVYTAAYGNVRSGTGVNGKAYFSDYNGSKKTYAVDANGISEFVTVDGVATGITSDDAGNIIVNRGHGGAGSGINMTVISADGKTQNNITLTMPEGVSNGMTMGIGRAIGNILSDEGGYFYLAEQNQNKVVMIQMKNGKQVAAKASAEMKYTFDATTVAHPILSMDQIAEAADAQTLATTTKISDPENYFAVRVRGNRYITLVEGDKVTNLPTTWNADAKKGTSTMDGFGIFTLGDETYQVLPVIINSTGSYGNEFQILNSKGEVIENFTLGNDKSGVPSYCGITARPISKTQAEIYIVYSNPDGQSTAMYTYGYYSEPEVTEPEYTITGTMTGQQDMNVGQTDEPDLIDPITVNIQAAYEDGKLTIKPMMTINDNVAITFTVDPVTGDAVAENTFEETRDLGDGTLVDYYYGDFTKKERKLYGKVVNIDNNHAMMTIDPWGEIADYSAFDDLGDYFEVLYYNTVATFNCTFEGLPTLEPEYNVYSNGTVTPDANIGDWWKASMDFNAANPTGAEGKVFEFKAADGGAAASMGFNLVRNVNTGKFHDATLNFDWYTDKVSKYTVRLTGLNSQDYSFQTTDADLGKWNHTSLKVAEVFPQIAQEWNEDLNFGEGHIFSIILDGGVEGDVIYLDNINYTGLDEEWEAPEHIIPAPETVPVPEQDAKDVVSVFSSAYEPAVTFGNGNWNQSTVATVQDIDDAQVYYLRNFDYLGWEFQPAETVTLDVSDYDYLHVDYWTADEGAGFGITPVTREGTVKEKGIEQEVALNEWNSYDVALSDFAEAGMDLSTVFQIKFDYGKNKNGYVANVYFWKKPFQGEERELVAKNVYAYAIVVTGNSDRKEATVSYKLNGKTKSVSIQPMVDGKAVGQASEGTTDYDNQVVVEYPEEALGKLTFVITAVPETTVDTPTLVENSPVFYTFWSPTTIAVNTDPETETFGRALTVENRYNNTPFTNSAYHAVGRGGAVYAFDPTHQPINAEDGKPGFKFGLKDNSADKVQVYGDYMDLRYAAGNKLYFASADLNKDGLYEIDPDDMDATAQPMFESGKDHRVWAFDTYTYADGSTKFVVLESNDANAGQVNGVTAARVMIYDLGEDGYLTNGTRVAEGYGFPNGIGMKVRIDPDGQGFYVSSHRGDSNPAEPHLIHSDMEGNLDVNDYTTVINAGAMGYNHDNTLFARAEGNAIVAVYRVSEVAAVAAGKAPAMEKLITFNAGIGNPIMAVAFDYANNIYVSGNNAEKFQQFQLPASVAGESTSVPSPSSMAIDIDTTGVANVVVDAEDGVVRYYNLNGVMMPAGAKLPAGVYVKVVGKTATKVVVK